MTLWRMDIPVVNFARVRCACAATLVLAALAGCGRKAETLTTLYGGRRGDAAASVNGLGVLAGMFESAGHSVASRTSASSGIDDAQVIIWAPDNFEPPTAEERALVEAWLTEEADRTFVYIGRDYDAAPHYWRRVAERAAPSDFVAAAREAALAASRHDTARAAMPVDSDARWFVVQRDRPRTRVALLSGEWSADIDAASAEILLQGQFELPASETTSAAASDEESNLDEYDEDYDNQEDYGEEFGLSHEVLLAAAASEAVGDDPFDEAGGFRPADGAPLVTRVSSTLWGSSQLIVVTNGSFLLNLPLVNHEHRQLAGRLIEACGQPGKTVIWESAAFRATSGSGEDEWSVLTTWPLNFILLHLAVLGMLYILWRFPIFGQAHTLRPPATSDFAKHIDALGKLTAATGDESYARRKLQEYRYRRDT